jgi:8-oxo-dGTP pyrophosphatase MutT (NUDIX family)
VSDPADGALADAVTAGPRPADPPDLVDVHAPRRVLTSELVHNGAIWDVVTETVDLGEAGVVRRDLLHHPGAVTVLALDHEDRVLMIRQYRHATGMELWELPAGLLDVVGEPPLLAAQRELAEEADLRADRWDLLIDWFNSPGGSDEMVRLFLARDVHPVPDHERHERTDEELGMPTRWLPLEQARDAVLAGRIHNPGSVIGILAAWASRELGWSTLRPADAPWPEHHAVR